MKDLSNMFFQDTRWKIVFVLIIGWSNLCIAQENIRFDKISVNEGLSQSDVKTFIQDKFGFLWIGTRDGLNKYDGFEFHNYNREPNNSTSLYFNQILDLQMDSSGNIWIGSVGGISIYDYRNDRFRNYILKADELKKATVNHILLVSDSAALLSTSKGLVNFDLKQKNFFIDPGYKSFFGLHVFVTHQDTQQGLWVGTSKGVFVKTLTDTGWKEYLPDRSIHNISIDGNENVYLSTSRGLFMCELKKMKFEQVKLPNDPTPVMDVRRMKNGDLWVACNEVVVLDRNNTPLHVLGHDRLNNYSLSENRAQALFQTNDSVIWVGTFGYGLNKYNPAVNRFSYLDKQTAISLSGNYVSSIFTFDDTLIWVGTSRGLSVVDLSSKSVQHFSHGKDLFQVFKIINDGEGNVWVTTSSGLMLYSGNKLIPKNSLGSVYDLAAWDEEHLILATRLQGLYLFNRKTSSTSVFISSGDLKEEVSCLLVEDNNLWIGCRDGLKLFDKEGRLIKNFSEVSPESGSLHVPFIKSVYRDVNRNLWIGTWGGGLSILNTKDSTFTTFNTTHGLPSNVVYGILEDTDGNFWLSTNHGLSAFNPRDHSFRNFYFNDGLQSNEFNTGAYFRSPHRTMYFGGISGLTFFKPEDVLVPQSFPSILLTSIVINNQLYAQGRDSLMSALLTSNLKLQWKENDIGVKFTAIDFKSASTRHFQYSVDAEAWHDIGNRRGFELLDLSSGHYEINIRTRNTATGWSSANGLLTIDIVPPIWQKGWFRTLAFFILVALIYGGYRLRIARLKRHNVLLHKLVKERTSELQSRNEEIISQNDQLNEINKELEAFSYSVSHDLRTPLRSVIGYSTMLEEDFQAILNDEGRKFLTAIRQNATRMNILIEDLLEFSKIGKWKIQKSNTDTMELVRNILDQINSSNQHVAEIRLSSLPAVDADHTLLSQVWMNLLSNAIKYSSKRSMPVVEIGSHVEENEIVFFVRDNGAGFDMKFIDKLFNTFQRLHKSNEFEGTGVGLALVKRIVSRHGGRVWAEGKVDEGATFYFSLPK